MSGRAKKKAPAVHSSPPVALAGEIPEVKDSRSLKSESPIAGLNDRRLTVAVCLFLALAVWAVFGQTLHHEFVNYDDDDQVYEHPVVKSGLSFQGVVWAFTHSDDGHWNPLNKISHMLDCQFYGLKPGGHHLTNVLLHAATVILLFLILQRMTAATWPSAFVAIVFAIHPLRVESVAWVAERKDLLSGFFFMLTLWAYVRYVRRTEIRGRQSSMRKLSYGPQPLTSVDYWLALLFFACGLMSKAMVATLPLVLLLLDYWPLNRFLRPVPVAATDKKKLLSVSKRLILEKIPFLGLIVAAGMGLLFSRDRSNMVVVVALQTGHGLVPHRDLSPMVRTGQALLTPLVYLKQMFFPAGLVVSYPPGQSVPPLEMVMAVILLITISVVVLVRRRKQPYLVVGWFWYLVMLAPVLMLIQRGAEVRCDRYTYLPQIGLYLLLTWAAAELCAGWRHRRMVLGGCATVILLALIFCARVQTSYWRNSESLWAHTLACTPDNAIAHNSLGVTLLQKGKVDEAIIHYQKALQITPDYPLAYINLGNALLRKGNVDEAIVHYLKALQITPDYAEAYINLGNALLQKGDVDEAITCFQKALQIKPDYAGTYYNLGNALLQKGNVDEAIIHYQKALQIKPDLAEAHYNLGNALIKKGNMDEAIVHYQKALQIKSDYAEAHINLGNALNIKGSVDEAIVHFQKALQIKPDYAEAHINLGNALNKKGSVDEAIVHYQKALQIKPDSSDVLNNLAWLLATCPDAHIRDGVQAVKYAGRACELTHYGVTSFVSTLAAAYAEAGRFDDAMAAAEKACTLASAAGEQGLLKRNQELLVLYRAHQPYHEAAEKFVPVAP